MCLPSSGTASRLDTLIFLGVCILTGLDPSTVDTQPILQEEASI